jgi:hypothetical protein
MAPHWACPSIVYLDLSSSRLCLCFAYWVRCCLGEIDVHHRYIGMRFLDISIYVIYRLISFKHCMMHFHVAFPFHAA